MSAAIEEENAEFIASLGPNRSASIRRVVSAGVGALRGETLTSATLEELRGIANRLEATLRRTPTGCWFAATPEAMPEPDALQPWDCVAMPHGLLVVAPQAALTVDMLEQRLTLQGAGHGPVTLDCEPKDLLQIAARFLSAVLEQAEVARPCELPLGLVLQRGADDLIHLTMEGQPIALPLDLALTIAAELTSLAVRSVDATCQRREQLERALQGVAP